MGEIFIKLFWDVLLVAPVVWWAGIEPRILCRLDKHPPTVLQKQQEDQSGVSLCVESGTRSHWNLIVAKQFSALQHLENWDYSSLG